MPVVHVWQPACTSIRVAQNGNSKSWEKTTMKKNPVKKASKQHSVKPLKAGPKLNVTSLKVVS